jgi:outer membrane receptor protein involved in Fe transport
MGAALIGGDMHYQSAEYQTGLIVAEGTIPAYTVFNAHVTWSTVMGKPFDLTFYVTNLTNKTYLSSIPLNVLELGNLGVKTGLYAPPRMFGVTAKVAF